jgi:feruloyl esterase
MVPGIHPARVARVHFLRRVEVLDRWVESGNAPERIVATQYDPPAIFTASPNAETVRTRPLCPWPKVARYNGEGSTDDAANFICD